MRTKGKRLSAKDKLTQTPAFLDWFDDSLMREASGKPQVLYHGTAAKEKFEAFMSGRPNYFTARRDYAEMYANKAMYGGKGKGRSRVYEVFMRMEKPFDTLDPKAREIFNEEFLPYWTKRFPRQVEAWPEYFRPLAAGERVHYKTADQLWSFLRTRERAGNHDYDGLIVDEGGFDESDEPAFVPLHPEQVKSVKNKGAFSRQDPNIFNGLGALPKSGRGLLSGVIEDLGLKLEEEVSESDDMLDVRLYAVNAKGDEVGLVHAAHGGGRFAAIEDAKINEAYRGKGLYPTMLMEMLNTLKGYGVKGIVSTPEARVGDDSRRSWEKFAQREPRVRRDGDTFTLEGLPKSGRIPLDTAKRVMKRLPAKTRACGITPAALREGMEIEREHRDVTKGGVLATAKIAAAHLCERKDYYKRLKKYVER
jgi:hypothetical protein